MTEYDHRELMCVAQIAATLIAGESEMAYRENVQLEDAHYARRAWSIYRAVAAEKEGAARWCSEHEKNHTAADDCQRIRTPITGEHP